MAIPSIVDSLEELIKNHYVHALVLTRGQYSLVFYNLSLTTLRYTYDTHMHYTRLVYVQ